MMPLIEAHRGDSSNAPENTRAAFALALRLGVPWIELDVHPARDGTLMVIHDDRVDRTTDGSGAVCDLTVGQLSRLDAGVRFSPAYTGERIPRLVDMLEMVAPTATRINVEIKSSPRGKEVPQTVVDLLRRFGKEQEYIVSSFNLRSLLDVRAVDSRIPLALIGKMPGLLAQAVQHQLPWIHANHTTVTGASIMDAHAHGIQVSVWTVDDAEKWSFWRDAGVDKICTNRPAVMLAAGRDARSVAVCSCAQAGGGLG